LPLEVADAHRLMTGTLLLIAVGLTATTARLAGAAPLADLMALAYLCVATVTFGHREAQQRTRK
jgi:hypothetical protein